MTGCRACRLSSSLCPNMSEIAGGMKTTLVFTCYTCFLHTLNVMMIYSLWTGKPRIRAVPIWRIRKIGLSRPPAQWTEWIQHSRAFQADMSRALCYRCRFPRLIRYPGTSPWCAQHTPLGRNVQVEGLWRLKEDLILVLLSTQSQSVLVFSFDFFFCVCVRVCFLVQCLSLLCK